jgi:RimJ/RimL family protein N-acetyltransferase
MEDVGDVTTLAGERDIASTTLSIPHPYDRSMAEDWIQSHHSRLVTGEGIVFAIILKDNGQLVGSIGLGIEKKHQRAALGYWIGKPYWNRGYATEAAGLVIKFGFLTLGLNRIHATHLIRNPGSGRVMKKNGMKFEGCLRQHILKWGKFEDLNYYAILKEDYQKSISLGAKDGEAQ